MPDIDKTIQGLRELSKALMVRYPFDAVREHLKTVDNAVALLEKQKETEKYD